LDILFFTYFVIYVSMLMHLCSCTGYPRA